MSDRILTRQETILLHLLQYIDVPVSEYVMPYAMTQQGIGLAAGMSRAHVSGVIGEMRNRELVDCVHTHPKGVHGRMMAYFLLPAGIQKARDIKSHLDEEHIDVEDVIRRPGSSDKMTHNVIKALEALDRARNAVAAYGTEGDPAKTRAAIEYASAAIISLTREVVE